MTRAKPNTSPSEHVSYEPSASAWPYTLFQRKKEGVTRQLRAAAGEVRLQKDTSNLFRDRVSVPATKIDVRAFNAVLDIDTRAQTVDVEGMTPYAALAAATFAKEFLPAVVPQLKSITIGGALAGLGIESSSFRYGLVHETVQEIEVLLADGDVVLCTPENQYKDLFFAFPNSFGTLGYALRVRAKIVPAKPFVRLTHQHHESIGDYFRQLDNLHRQEIDFLDGVVFAPNANCLTVGKFVDDAPYTSDYTYMNIYYRSIRERQEDYLTTLDYIWRWETDWFWCSRVLFAQNPLVRRLLGKHRLNSTFYKKVSDWNNRYRLRQRLRRITGVYSEPVIQDVDIPLVNAAAFLEFFHREIGLTPIWICPFRSYDPSRTFPLFPTDPQTLYVNFGFWDAVTRRTPFEEGYFNRKIESEVAALGGIKSLYSDSYYSEAAFWSIYNREAYERVKSKYDPKRRLADLYRKCVKRE